MAFTWLCQMKNGGMLEITVLETDSSTYAVSLFHKFLVLCIMSLGLLFVSSCATRAHTFYLSKIVITSFNCSENFINFYRPFPHPSAFAKKFWNSTISQNFHMTQLAILITTFQQRKCMYVFPKNSNMMFDNSTT